MRARAALAPSAAEFSAALEAIYEVAIDDGGTVVLGGEPARRGLVRLCRDRSAITLVLAPGHRCAALVGRPEATRLAGEICAVLDARVEGGADARLHVSAAGERCLTVFYGPGVWSTHVAAHVLAVGLALSRPPGASRSGAGRRVASLGEVFTHPRRGVRFATCA